MKKWRDFHFPGKGENCLSEFYYVKCVFEFLCNSGSYWLEFAILRITKAWKLWWQQQQ